MLAGVPVFLLLAGWAGKPKASHGARSLAVSVSSNTGKLGILATAPAPATAPGPNYSVIPGGIHSEKQLAAVLARNPVVAKHYANFDLAKMRFVRLRRGRRAYVSYRLGNLILWTSRKIPLFAGEMLVTDGTHFARARCGNRISEVPREPTSSFEPPDWALAAPILHLTPASFTFPALSAVRSLPTATLADSSGGLPFFPPVVFIPPGGGSGGTPFYPPAGDGPIPTPEPGTLLLFSTGLTILGMKRFWHLRRR